MANDGPGSGDWASPSEPTAQPPYFTPAPSPPPAPGWGPPAPGWGQPGYGWGPPQPPRPGIIPLRPLAVGEILDGAFTTIRRYPGATLGLTAPIMLVVEALRIATSYYLLHGINTDITTTSNGAIVGFGNVGDYAGRTATLEIIVTIATLVATALLSGIIATIVGQGALGRPMSAGDAWRATVPSLWRLLGASLLVLLITGGVVVVGVLPGILIAVAGATGAGVALAVLGGIAAFVVALYLAIALSLATPALMLEKQGVFAALSRSRLLVRGSWWRIFGITLLAGIITLVISGIISAPFAIFGGGVTGIFSGNTSEQFSFTPLLLTGIGGLIASTLVRPFSSGVIALLYLDRRMRAEGLDHTLQQAAANPNP